MNAGWFDPELVPAAWFDPELLPLAWFDRELADVTAAGDTLFAQSIF